MGANQTRQAIDRLTGAQSTMAALARHVDFAADLHESSAHGSAKNSESIAKVADLMVKRRTFEFVEGRVVPGGSHVLCTF